jgi:uncharacterized membrane protein YhaH (DUF805 family)
MRVSFRICVSTPPTKSQPPRHNAASPLAPAAGIWGNFKLLRILVLLLVLLAVAHSAWHDRDRSTRWKESLFVAIYPIAADDSATTRAYVAAPRPCRIRWA